MAALNGAVGRWRSRARSVSHADRSARTLVGLGSPRCFHELRDDSWDPLLNLVQDGEVPTTKPPLDNECSGTTVACYGVEWRAVVGETSQPI